MKYIAAIIVTYKNSPEELTVIKKALLENGLQEKDIFFSDNTNENLGYGGGINRILSMILQRSSKSNYDYFFIVNPDVIVHKDCIKILSNTLESNPHIGIDGPTILDKGGKIWALGGMLDKNRYTGGLLYHGEKNHKAIHQDASVVDFISGTAMLVRREVFEKIGLFAEDYFLYYEDVDFCLRAKRVGFLSAISPQAQVTHFASRTVGKNSPAMQYYLARNHLYIVERFGIFRVKLYEILRLPKTLYEARRRKHELLGLRDYFLRKVGL